MNAAGDITPPLGPTQLAAGHAPPTPPHESALDDIYGSAPTSPYLSAQQISERTHEMLSDLPSRQRALDADAYREGLASAKGQYVQEGFDEGYALGADLGLRVGYILGVLRGFVGAWKGQDQEAYAEVSKLYADAQKELAIEQLLGQTWIDEEGIWKWEVKGADGDATFREVAAQHPVVKRWDELVDGLARRWGVDLKAVEKMSGKEEEMS
ncbi:Essential protein Yae1, N terminal [Neodidymelliopsis sp. IMI 364377]|nr:Essential protein Yae1, N terminal [Neodidymelliopsis sp. IMI 364377]